MENNWHDIPGYEGLYQFNWHTNQVINIKSKYLLRVATSKGRVYCTLNHRIIPLGRITLLITQGPKPKGLVCCHNDGNPWNNYPDNVRYDTQKSNIHDAIKHGTFIPIKKRIAIKRSDGKIFESMHAAMRSLGKNYPPANISMCCSGKIKTAYGYSWEYIS